MKMPWSRRSVLGGLAGGAIAGAGQMSTRQGLSHKGMPLAFDQPTETQANPMPPDFLYGDPPKKLMEKWQAIAHLLDDKKTRDELTSSMYESHRHVQFIDPDIACMKSFSQMAKITFMRQRLVELELKQVVSEPPNKLTRIFQDKINKLMYGDAWK